MNEEKIKLKNSLLNHFSQPKVINKDTFFSGFIAALRDARITTGRNIDGNKINSNKHGSWIGTIGYMALLDQIGTCFKPLGESEIQPRSKNEKVNTITKALKYFSSLPDNEIDALYALRCAFAHDFSLFNINRKNQSLQHRFQVEIGGSMEVVKLPSEPWDGNYKNINHNNVTIINLEALGDLVEDIYNRLFKMIESENLEIILDGGIDELIQRYSFYTNQ